MNIIELMMRQKCQTHMFDVRKKKVSLQYRHQKAAKKEIHSRAGRMKA